VKLRLATDGPKSHGFGAGIGSDPQPMPRSHSHGDLELNFVYSGRLRYFLSGRTVEVPAQTLAVFWAGLPHQVLSTAPNTAFMWLHVPFETVLRWSLGNEFMERLLAGGLILDHEGLPWDAELTRGWLEDLRRHEHGLDAAIELEVEARVRRLVRSQRCVLRAPSTDEQRRRQVTAMASFLAAHYREEVQIKEVARAANLSPNYAMTLFRRECGLSIGQYLTRLRIADAQVELLCTDKTVLAIALESGFGSLAGFYAAFQKECGIAPGEYRKQSPPEFAADVKAGASDVGANA
jgi:AraC family transcriptional regulator, melibiose operon regulatory protein